MTIQEIERTFQTMAVHQARQEKTLADVGEILHTLADRQIKTDEILTELAAAQLRSEERQERLEATFQMLEELTKNTRNEIHDRVDRIDERLNLVAEHLDEVTLRLDGLTIRVDQLGVR